MALLRQVSDKANYVITTGKPRLRHRWEEGATQPDSTCLFAPFKVVGAKVAAPKMALLYDFVIMNCGIEICRLAVKKWSESYSDVQGSWWFDFLLLAIGFVPMFTVWIIYNSYVNLFDPHEPRHSATRGGELTLLAAICMLLGSIYNAPACFTFQATTIFDAHTCAVSFAFMGTNRFVIMMTCLSTFFFLSPEDRRQAKVWLFTFATHGLLTASFMAGLSKLVATHGSDFVSGFFLLPVLDLGVMVTVMQFPRAWMLPADLTHWVMRTENVFKAGLISIVIAALRTGFSNKESLTTSEHMVGFVTPMYAYAFKVLYFDHVADIPGVYIDGGHWRFLTWLLMHVPLMLALLLVGLSLSLELQPSSRTLFSSKMLPATTFIALCSNGVLEVVLASNVATYWERRNVYKQLLQQVILSSPLLFMPLIPIPATLTIWAPGIIAVVVSWADRCLRHAQESGTDYMDRLSHRNVTIAGAGMPLAASISSHQSEMAASSTPSSVVV